MQLTDVELMALIKRVDPRAIRIPPGVRAIADELCKILAAPAVAQPLTDEQHSALLTVLECADTSERHRTNQAWINLREAIASARALLANGA